MNNPGTDNDRQLIVELQAVHAAERDREADRQQSLKLRNEYESEWRALCFRFEGWAFRTFHDRDIPGYATFQEFTRHVATLVDVTVRFRGDNALSLVADFDASRYKTNKKNKTQFFHAIAVSWILKLTAMIAGGISPTVALKIARRKLAGFNEFELSVFASRLYFATYVIRSKEAIRDCPTCKKPMPVSQFDSEKCVECLNRERERELPGGVPPRSLRITDHPRYNKDKQFCLDFKNDGNSWNQMNKNEKCKFKRDTITKYATETGQIVQPAASGRPSREQETMRD